MNVCALPRIEIFDCDRTVAWADSMVETRSDGHVELLVSVSFAQRNGHRRPDLSAELIAHVLQRATDVQAHRMSVSIPAGDVDTIDALHSRTPAATTHLAGSTCIAEVELDSTPRGALHVVPDLVRARRGRGASFPVHGR